MPVPSPASTWKPYCEVSIWGEVLIRDSSTTPMISRTAPASTTPHGGILGLPIKAPARADPMGIIAPNAKSLKAAESGETSLTVTKRCGI